MAALLNRRVDLNTWLVLSTVISIFLIIQVGRIGADIFAGYPVVIFNTYLLLVTNRLVIHKGHAIAIAVVTLLSIVAARYSPTQPTAIISQIVGIALMSVCYFSVLLTSGLTVPRWMELYAGFAFLLAIIGIGGFIAQHTLHFNPEGEQRLKAIFTEPSLFVYTTLPAIGYYINTWVTERRYGLEVLIFLLAYVLADAALGFVGLLFIGMFTLIKRFTIWHVLGGLLVGGAMMAGVFLASEGFANRVSDTAGAIANQSLANTNGSTFAFLSNVYVAGNALADHPVLGVGIGGYRAIYDTYIGDLGTEELGASQSAVGLNRDDANSLFLRVAAEMGVPGLLALFAFLIVCARVDGKPYRQIRNALLPYFLVRMGRFGAYFSMELYFFVGLYLLNYLDYRRSIAAGAPAPLPAPTPSQPVLRPA